SGFVSYGGSQIGPMRVGFWGNSGFTGTPAVTKAVPTGAGAFDAGVPAGGPYYLRPCLVLNNSVAFNAFAPSGIYSAHGKAAEAGCAPSAGSVVGLTFSMLGAGQLTGGVVGEGSAVIAPPTAAAGASVFSATITYTAGTNGVNVGGKVGFTVPPGWAA